MTIRKLLPTTFCETPGTAILRLGALAAMAAAVSIWNTGPLYGQTSKPSTKASIKDFEARTRTLIGQCDRDGYLAEARIFIAAVRQKNRAIRESLRSKRRRQGWYNQYMRDNTKALRAPFLSDEERRQLHRVRRSLDREIRNARDSIVDDQTLLETNLKVIREVQRRATNLAEVFTNCSDRDLQMGSDYARYLARVEYLEASPTAKSLLEAIEAHADRCELKRVGAAYDRLIQSVDTVVDELFRQRGLPLPANKPPTAVAADIRRILEIFRRAHLHRLAKECKDRNAPIPRVGPINGIIVEPLVAFGLGLDRANGSYRSTGPQTPFSGNPVEEAQSALMAGVDVLVPLATLFGTDPLARATAGQLLTVASPYLGLGLRAGLLFQNDKVAVDIVRHGADGRVALSERELANVGLYVMFGIPISVRLRRRPQRSELASLAQGSGSLIGADYLSLFLYGGVGPNFTNTRVTLSSNKDPGGGTFTRTSKTEWDTGLGALAGVRAVLCRTCAFGSSLRLGFEWQGRWMPTRSVATTSPTFGFVESGRIGSRFSQQFMLTLSIPFTLGLR